MRRFEFRNDKSEKFWVIDRQGCDVHLSWGRIGTQGQRKTKSFDSEAKAEAEYEKLIRSKTKKGYVESEKGEETTTPARVAELSQAEDRLEFPKGWDKLRDLPDNYYGMSLVRSLVDNPLEHAKKSIAANRAGALYNLAHMKQCHALAHLIDKLGAESAVALIAVALEGEEGQVGQTKLAAQALSFLPSDMATHALLNHAKSRNFTAALTENSKRFPQRFLRVSSSHKNFSAVQTQLRQLLQDNPGIEAEIQELSERHRERLAGLREESTRIKEAPKEKWPEVLQNPPWLRPQVQTKRDSLDLPTLEFKASLIWRPGEEEAARKVPVHSYAYVRDDEICHMSDDWDFELQYCVESQRTSYVDCNFTAIMAVAPEPMARKALEHQLRIPEINCTALPRILARFGEEAIPIFHNTLASKNHHHRIQAGYFGRAISSVPLALHHAELSVQKEQEWLDSRSYLLRHSEAAAVALIPLAFGEDESKREMAELTLHNLTTEGHRDIVLEVAERYGLSEDNLDGILNFDTLKFYPKKRPDTSKCTFFRPEHLPQLILKDGSGALGTEALGHLATMMAFSDVEDVYAGIKMVREVITPESAARFAWALFEAWLAEGGPAKQGWGFYCLAWFGDDHCVSKLTPMIRQWPGKSLHKRAVTGLSVLAGIGTELALTRIHDISLKIKFRGLQAEADKRINQIAEARGLTSEELADRLVPKLGLDSDGSLTLDYGTRQFQVRFNEHLVPFAVGDNKKLLKNPPKPGKNDNPEMSKAAAATFKLLKKEAKQTAKNQLLRLEQAMCGQRRWTTSEFQDFFVAHPLMIHLVRRLVWGMFDGTELKQLFMVAEDRSFMDADYNEIELRGEIGLPHPLEMGETPQWAAALADFKLLQPFPQVSREVYKQSPEEAKSKELADYSGLVVPVERILGLERRGWELDEPEGGTSLSVTRYISGHIVALELRPGIYAGDKFESPDQMVESVKLFRARSPLAFGKLSAPEFSELKRELADLKQGT